MKLKACIKAATVLSMVAGWSCAFGGVHGGREPEGVGMRLELSGGQMLNIEGSVRETKRAYTDTPGEQLDYGHYLENYDLQELGFDSSYPAFGLNTEFRGRWLSLEIGGFYSKLDATATAEREPFALGVEEIEYQGETYEYMLIEQGQSFEAELESGTLAARLLLTPFHLKGHDSGWSLSPWLSAGLYSFFGRYSIDAGEPRGLTTYEFHPYTYVVGGQAEGWTGLVVPELGGGGELAVGLGQRHDGQVRLVLRGDYATFQWDGLTGDLGVESRNEKRVDLDYSSWEGRCHVEMPLSNGWLFLVGVRYRHMEADATIEAEHRSSEDQQQRKEKYDKEVEMSLDTLLATIGFEF